MKVQGNNNYNLEGSPAGRWMFNIVKGTELLTNSIINNLKNFADPIYFNDLTGKHWIFDFKIDDVWAEAVKVDCNNMIIDLVLWR